MRRRSGSPELPDLRVVQVLSAGVDWVERHVPDGVTFCNAGDTRSPAVAQWVVAAILADLIGFQRAEAARLARSWEHWQPRELAGRRVVIVGYGSIGRAVERRLAPFGVRIGRVARSARPGVEPVERLAQARRGRRRRGRPRAAVGRHARARRRGRDRAHAARRAARQRRPRPGGRHRRRSSRRSRPGQIRAALDVTDPEPLPEDHVLWTLDGVFITPHNAGDTPEAEAAAQALARAQMLRYRAGLPLHHVVSGSARPSR